LRELAGLFVDNDSLALAILGLVAIAAIAAALTSASWAGVVLLVGCPGVLLGQRDHAIHRH